MSRFHRLAPILTVVLALACATPSWSFVAGPPVSPTITAQPIHVVIWMRNNVTAEDSAQTVAGIEAGLALWENVPTSHIAFDTEVIHSATEPPTEPEDLLVIAAYDADLAQGGASVPSGGFPGTWFGAVADYGGAAFPLVAAHEIGHAIGFIHSSVGSLTFAENIPVMHWAVAGVVGLTDDDVALVSTMYPSTTTPLGSVTGEIRGRVESLGTGLPLDGVNVVAVDAASGAPSVGCLTGQGLSPDGVFRLIGLPPGNYNVRLLDGKSFAGVSVGMANEDIQADNFPATTLGPFSVVAGGVIDLSDVPLAIEPMSFDRIGTAIVPLPGDLDPEDGELPQATVGSDYNAFLHLRGGARPVKISDAPHIPGVTSFVLVHQQFGADPHGNALLLLSGRPALPGFEHVEFALRDDHGVEATMGLDLTTLDPCAPPLADLDGDGVCDDNCPYQPNPDQQDTDADGEGDRCDVVFLPQLIDFESDGAGVPFTTSLVALPLGEYADRGLRFSPMVTQSGSLLYFRDVSVTNQAYVPGFSNHFLVFTGPNITELHFNPPITEVSFAFAAPGGFNPPVKVQGLDGDGNLVIDTAIQGTQPWGFLFHDQYAFVPTAPLVTLRFDPQNSNAMRLDNLAYRSTNCAIGLDPEGDGVCDASHTVPPVVPDGIAGSPLLISRGLVAGSLELSWDVTTCPATNYNILYGNLSAVGSYTPTGSVCDLGTSGTFQWPSPPAGNLWMLIVGHNGNGVEGSWGRNSSGQERVTHASGECDNVFLSAEAECSTP